MQIIRGKIKRAQKVVIYGPEGIGKSTFAAQFPDPLFIDTEGSTSNMDVARTPKATSWTMMRKQVDEIKINKLCRTLVIDTIDWAEQMSVEHILAKHQKAGIEDFGYGNGYVYVKEEMGRFLNQLQEVVDSGINVVLTAHAQMRKFEQPDELGAYDRYELKLGKKTSSQTSPLIKEWADALLFCNYKTYSVAVDDKGKKHKAQGGKRVMYTAHHPCWDAKNRWELPEEVPFEYSVISEFIPFETESGQQVNTPVAKQPEPQKSQSQAQTSGSQQLQTEQEIQQKKQPEQVNKKTQNEIPQSVLDLMNINNISETDIMEVVISKGYAVKGTTLAECGKIENSGVTFFDGWIIPYFDNICKMSRDFKLARGEFINAEDEEGLPFDKE